jgi:hypothetical protein
MAVRVVFALPELDNLLSGASGFHGSSLINYKVPEFLPSHFHWEYQHDSF